MNELFLGGERGLVTAFFQDLASPGTLERWKSFLQLLKFPNYDLLSNVWCVIEPDFGNKGFGHPDMAAVLDFNNAPRSALFLEAKLTTLKEASWPGVKRMDKGFNSTINGQLELNHRLTLALSIFEPDVRLAVSEPDWILDTPYIMAIPGRPRCVKKPSVLNLVARKFEAVPLRAVLSRYHHY